MVMMWRTDSPELPTRQSAHFTKPVWMHDPNFVDTHGDGWRTVGYQFVGQHPSGDLIISVMLARDIPVEGDVSGLVDP